MQGLYKSVSDYPQKPWLLHVYVLLCLILFGELTADIRRQCPRIYCMPCQSPINLYMEDEVIRRPLRPQIGIAFCWKGIIGRIHFYSIELSGVELQAWFSGPDFFWIKLSALNKSLFCPWTTSYVDHRLILSLKPIGDNKRGKAAIPNKTKDIIIDGVVFYD